MIWQPFRGDAPKNMTIFSASFPDVSDQWPMKDDAAREIAALDRALKAEPALRPPQVEYQEGGRPCSSRRTAIPSRLSATVRRLPHGEPGWCLPRWRCLWCKTRLRIACRTAQRWTATVASGLSTRTMPSACAPAPGCLPRWWRSTFTMRARTTGSAASGAAIPVLEALREAKFDGQQVYLTLVDKDPVALSWAETMAAQEGIVVGEQLTLLRRNSVHTLVRNEDLLLELGEHQAELVDALGIFEYFNDADAVILLQRALRLVKPGGAVIVSNMLTSSPQIDFVLRGIGWEDIHPRTLQQLQDIHGGGRTGGKRHRGRAEGRGVCGDGSEGVALFIPSP